jgi:xanthine dehydrogenase YagR molybdenum-binding subunit
MAQHLNNGSDRASGPWVGQGLARVDGPAKVSGQAAYAYDHTANAAVGFFLESSVGKGRIQSIDTKGAEKADGVIAIFTHENTPKMKPFGKPDSADRFTQSHAALNSPDLRYHGDPVALVVAETLEQARYAASLIAVRCEAEDDGIYGVEGHEGEAYAPDSLDGADEADIDVGDFDKVWAASSHKVEARYETGAQHAAAMEPHATVAEWDEDGTLTIHAALQVLAWARKALANTFGIDADKIRIVAPFVGGGFGSKLGIHTEAVLAAMAARELKRPVRIAQTRRQVFANGPHRERHLMTVAVGADDEGKLLAVGHESISTARRNYAFAENVAGPALASYAAKALKARHRIIDADIPSVDSMRAPGEAIGTLTFETAIDELAEKCGIDPLRFRIMQEPETDPATDKPFASRDLVRCLEEGAAHFGWDKRNTKPGQLRRGDYLIGHGMAVAIRPNMLMEAKSSVSLSADGKAEVQMDMTDIGTGTYTIITQVAADALGLSVEDVTVRLGDTDFAETCGSGGSFGAGSTASATQAACKELKKKLVELVRSADTSVRGDNDLAVTLKDGAVHYGSASMALSALFASGKVDGVSAEGAIKPGDDHETYAQYSYGAQFAEVGVHAVTGEIRVLRLSGTFSAGRILNAKTARSQLMGGMIFGLGGALLEESLMDERYGAFMNRDLAEYHLAVNRDVPALDVHIIETPDTKSNPIGSKGIGELGICGAGPAIINAVYNATGYRARKFPLHMEDLLDALPAV